MYMYTYEIHKLLQFNTYLILSSHSPMDAHLGNFQFIAFFSKLSLILSFISTVNILIILRKKIKTGFKTGKPVLKQVNNN